jgi:hypothetical protein
MQFRRMFILPEADFESRPPLDLKQKDRLAAVCPISDQMIFEAAQSSRNLCNAEIATKFSIDPGNFTLERKFRFKPC